MKAIIASKPGGPEVLKIINTDEPEVQRGEVKITVGAKSAYNFVRVFTN